MALGYKTSYTILLRLKQPGWFNQSVCLRPRLQQRFITLTPSENKIQSVYTHSHGKNLSTCITHSVDHDQLTNVCSLNQNKEKKKLDKLHDATKIYTFVTVRY